MRKISKTLFLISSVITLLPIFIGLLLWNRLPAQLPSHFGLSGEADAWIGKPFAVVVPYLILLAVHLLCIFLTHRDPGQEQQNRKLLGLVYWICPLCALFIAGLSYSAALGATLDVTSVTLLLPGILCVVIGNYLPKCRPNHTIGIRLPWTLADEENWIRTHRMSGPVFLAGGLLLVVCAFLPAVRIWAFPVLLFMIILIPSVYSYRLYRRKQQDN